MEDFEETIIREAREILAKAEELYESGLSDENYEMENLITEHRCKLARCTRTDEVNDLKSRLFNVSRHLFTRGLFDISLKHWESCDDKGKKEVEEMLRYVHT